MNSGFAKVGLHKARSLACVRPPQVLQDVGPSALRPARRCTGNKASLQLRRRLVHRAAFTDTPPWTLDQIAGLAFGAVMAASVYAAYKADALIARQQRRELGLCEACGGLNEPATCSEASCPNRTAKRQNGV